MTGRDMGWGAQAEKIDMIIKIVIPQEGIRGKHTLTEKKSNNHIRQKVTQIRQMESFPGLGGSTHLG